MDPRARVHLATFGILAGIVTVLALFWLYPKLLIYVTLAVVAALVYGALYLVLASRMDPREPLEGSAPESLGAAEGRPDALPEPSSNVAEPAARPAATEVVPEEKSEPPVTEKPRRTSRARNKEEEAAAAPSESPKPKRKTTRRKSKRTADDNPRSDESNRSE